MMSGVTCQVRLPRLLKPDSVSLQILGVEIVAVGRIVAATGGAPASKQPKLAADAARRGVLELEMARATVAVSTFGIRSKSTEAKKAVCLVSRTVSW